MKKIEEKMPKVPNKQTITSVKAAVLGTMTLALWYAPISYGLTTSAINSTLSANMGSRENGALALVKTKLASFFILNASTMLVMHYNHARAFFENGAGTPEINFIHPALAFLSLMPFVCLNDATSGVEMGLLEFVTYMALFFTSVLLDSFNLFMNNPNASEKTFGPCQKSGYLATAANYLIFLAGMSAFFATPHTQGYILKSYTAAGLLFNLIMEYLHSKNFSHTSNEDNKAMDSQSRCSFSWPCFPFSSRSSSDLNQAIEERGREGYGAIEMRDSRRGQEATRIIDDSDDLDIVASF